MSACPYYQTHIWQGGFRGALMFLCSGRSLAFSGITTMTRKLPFISLLPWYVSRIGVRPVAQRLTAFRNCTQVCVERRIAGQKVSAYQFKPFFFSFGKHCCKQTELTLIVKTVRSLANIRTNTLWKLWMQKLPLSNCVKRSDEIR